MKFNIRVLIFGAIGLIICLIPFLIENDTFDVELFITGISSLSIALINLISPQWAKKRTGTFIGQFMIIFGFYCSTLGSLGPSKGTMIFAIGSLIWFKNYNDNLDINI